MPLEVVLAMIKKLLPLLLLHASTAEEAESIVDASFLRARRSAAPSDASTCTWYRGDEGEGEGEDSEGEGKRGRAPESYYVSRIFFFFSLHD